MEKERGKGMEGGREKEGEEGREGLREREGGKEKKRQGRMERKVGVGGRER